MLAPDQVRGVKSLNLASTGKKSLMRRILLVLSLTFPLAAHAAGDLETGHEKARMCQTCHGIDGMAKVPDAPNIGGESPIYLERQLKAFRSGERQHEQMSIIAQGLSDEDIDDLVAWYGAIKIEATIPEGLAP